MADVKLCTDCRHSRESKEAIGTVTVTYPLKCSHRAVASRVDGRAVSACESVRIGDWLSARFFATCGREARWFEPKEAK